MAIQGKIYHGWNNDIANDKVYVKAYALKD